jgi:hypothetical protein
MAGFEKGRGPARATAAHLLELGAGPAMASDQESRERKTKKTKNGAAAWREQNAEGRRKASRGRELGALEGRNAQPWKPLRWGWSFSSTCLKEPTTGKW